MRKGFILAAVILVAIGVVLFGAALIKSDFDFSKADKYETNTYTASEAFGSIEIRSDEADITFKPSADGETRVECVDREKVKHEVTVENGVLKIVAVDDRAWYDHLTLFSFRPLSVTVSLPSADYEDIKIETSTGDIRIDGIRADQISLSVSTGRIEVNDVNCEGTLSVRVSTGKTMLSDILCKSLISNGSTGDVTLKNAVASDRFNIERSTGDVTFENCDAGQITVKTSTGDVSGTLRSGKVFFAKTSTGGVRVPNTVSGGRCDITTTTGEIDIDLVRTETTS